jgi:NAD+ kinase
VAQRNFLKIGQDVQTASESKKQMIRAVGIVSRPRREDVARVVPPLLDWLGARRLQAYYDHETASSIGTGGHAHSREELCGLTDLLIVLGGDGTLLAAARAMAECNALILPVNLGGLGFLTSVTQDELYPILELVLEGKHRVSERVLLQAEVIRNGQTVVQHRALNDAVLNKGALARMIDLEVRIDDAYVCNYKADGLIISTPTGSTAYSMAAGGPIVYPTVAAFVLTPICPHALTNRPLVIPDTLKIEVSFQEGEEPVFLTLDGQVGVELHRGDRVAVTKFGHKMRLVRPSRKTYFEILRSKLKWEER